MNIPPLRDYQVLAKELLYAGHYDGHQEQVLVVSTGGGKTTIAASIIHGAYEKGTFVIFLAHRKELVDQAKNRMHQFGLRPGVIMAGWRYRPNLGLYVASQQTLSRRELPELPEGKRMLIVVDECHHSVSAGFKKILNHYKDTYGKRVSIIGLTATPYRLDGKGLGDIYSNIVAPISLSELTERGFLVPARYVGFKMDMSNVATRGGDYDVHQMHAMFDKKEIYAGVVEHYNQFAPGTKAIVFNVDVKHSEKMRDAFIAAGISAAHVDGETPGLERSRILEAFKEGKFQVLCNVNILTEGFDLPAIETVILNRATKSKSLYLQMVGRGLRPAPGKSYCTVIDQGGNVWEHGPVDMEEEYTLETIKKKKLQQAAPVKSCPSCFFIQHVGARECKECGHVFTLHITERELPKEVFEELNDFLPKQAKVKPSLPDHLRKAWTDMTEDELKEVAAIRGYKPGWVWMQLNRKREAAA